MSENKNKEIKKISVKDFINKYNQLHSDELKDRMVKSLITRKYVPVLEKKLYLQVMLDNSIVDNNGQKYVDMFVNKINVTTAVLTLYTNLDLSNDNDKTKAFENYDLLAENDILNVLFNKIPESELTTILSINDQLLETFYNKNNSIHAFISEMVDRFSVTFGALANGSIKSLIGILDDEKKMNDIMNKLSNKDSIIQIAKKFVK